jgi:hypothetical protein
MQMDIIWKMAHLKRTLQATLLLCLYSGLLQAGLTPFTMSLKATKFGTVDLSVNGEQSLQPNSDGSWSLTLTTKHPLVSLSEVARFAWMDTESLPISYTSNARVGLSKKEKSMEFDRERAVIRVITKEKATIFNMSDDVVDLGSFQVNLMQHLRDEFLSLSQGAVQNKIAVLLGETYSQVVQDWDKQSTLEFTVIRVQVLDTPAGKLNTLLLYENNANRPSVSKRYWVASDYGFIPIKVEQYRNGKIESRIEIQSGQYGGTPIVGLP